MDAGGFELQVPTAGQVDYRTRNQYVTGFSNIHDPRRNMHGHPGQVAVRPMLHFPRMKTGPQAQTQA